MALTLAGVEEVALEVLCDGNRLLGGGVVPPEPRGVVLLLHGIPSTTPPEPGDAGYPGLALEFAEQGWISTWVDMRAVRTSEGVFSIEGWVRDATQALARSRELGGASGLPAAIVGSSAGGAVGAEVARRGGAVDALALLAAPAHWVSFAGHPTEGVRRITDEAGMSLAPEVLEDPAAWAAEFEAVSTAAAVPDLTVPVLVVHGTADDVVPVEHAGQISGAARNAELHVLEGAGHQLRRDPRAIALVLDWLAGKMP